LDWEAEFAYVPEAPQFTRRLERTVEFVKRVSDQKCKSKSKSCKNDVVEEDDGLVAQRRPKLPLLEFLDTLEPLEEEFPEIEDWPPRPIDL
jgi:hypothetical protein